MKKLLRQVRPELIALIVAAAATRLWDLFNPVAVIFDEVYFKAFAGHYLDHHYFFDIHPPLVKLLLAGWAAILHIPAADLISKTTPTVGLRVLPAIAGILIIPLFWAMLRRFGASRPFAFLGAFALLVDNALIVESRIIVMDSLLLLFGLSSIYFYLIARRCATRWYWLWLTLAAIAGGAALSTKWTGATALGLVGLMWLVDVGYRRMKLWRALGSLAILALVPLSIYVGVFWVHFQLLPQSGDGDAYMTPNFQATLTGSTYFNPSVHMSFMDKFIELNKEMFTANQTLTATHPYGSRWYTWPLELRPIYYWEGQTQGDGRQGNIYLLGNPAVWWGVLIAGITGLVYARARRIKLRPATVGALSLLGVAYLVNFLPFVGVPRVMFLYHYFFSFIYSVAFVVLLWNDLSADRNGQHQLESRASRAIYTVVIATMFVTFVYFIPLTYGTLLTPTGLFNHMWLKSWR
jgi:dolichyl-phosphate-mannose-protein mannosyltransferase